jgi:molybdopterin molybdotransferase
LTYFFIDIMRSVAQAEKLILDHIDPLTETESLLLGEAMNRILATDVLSPWDFPDWDNSAMDGYAVQFADVSGIDPENPTRLTVVEEIPAGRQPQYKIEPGQAARIFTGAMMPEGADTVVMQEQTETQAAQVIVLVAPQKKGAFVRSRGDYCQAGDSVLTVGSPIQAAEMAILATTQVTQVTVYRRPQVAIFSTGDELVSPGQPLKIGQIVDSNQSALTAFVQAQGAVLLALGIVSDRREMLKAKMVQAIEAADLVLSTGGVSVGDYDYIESLLEELGGEMLIRQVAIKPGKPLTVAKFPNGCLYFGIPGNPVSALVCCWRFVQPALRKLSGLATGWHPHFIQGRSLTTLKSDGRRETYLWGKVTVNASGYFDFQVAAGSHSSANLINLRGTNALAVIPVGVTEILAKERVNLLLLNL